MFIPDGYTEDEVILSLRKVARNLSQAFQFGYYDPEDIEQEGILIGIQALPNYNSKLSALETFLYTHIRNRLRTLKRDKFERKSPPCVQCNYNKCDQDTCIKLQNWVDRNDAKRTLTESSIKDITWETADEQDNVTNLFIRDEVINFLDQHMPIGLRADYLRLLDGAYVPKSRRLTVYNVARELLGELSHEER